MFGTASHESASLVEPAVCSTSVAECATLTAMKFLSVREFRNHPGRIWSRLKREDLVVTSNGKPVGILIGVAKGKMDEALSAVRRARAAIAVSRLRRRAAGTGIAALSARQIENEIRAARKERSRS